MNFDDFIEQLSENLAPRPKGTEALYACIEDTAPPPKMLQMFTGKLPDGRYKADAEVEPFRVRCSALPFCKRKFFLHHRAKERWIQPEHRKWIAESAAMMGNGLHEALQTWAGRMGFMYGNWKCPKCGWLKEKHTGIVSCSSCGVECLYEEFAFNEEGDFTGDWDIPGHVDGVFKLPGMHDIVVEFKGATAYAHENMTAPKPTHIVQANTYAMQLRKNPELYGCNPEEIVWLYYDRGNMAKPPRCFSRKPDPALYQEQKDSIRLGLTMLHDPTPPEGICVDQSSPWARFCPWSAVCFTKDRTLLPSIISPSIVRKPPKIETSQT